MWIYWLLAYIAMGGVSTAAFKRGIMLCRGDQFQFAGLITFLAAVVMLPMLLIRPSVPSFSEMLLGVASGLSFAVNLYGRTLAYDTAPAGPVMGLTALSQAAAIVWGLLFLAEKPQTGYLLGGCLLLVGLVVQFLDRGEGKGLAWIGWGLFSAVGVTGWMITWKYIAALPSPGWAAVVAYVVSGSTLMAVGWRSSRSFSRPPWRSVFEVGLTEGLSSWLRYYAMTGPLIYVAPATALMPVVTAGVSFVWLRERFGGWRLVGFALLMLGVWVLKIPVG